MRKDNNYEEGTALRKQYSVLTLPSPPSPGSKLDNNNIKHLTPFGQHLAQNVSSEMLPPNVRLDPSYVYLRSATTAPAFSEVRLRKFIWRRIFGTA